MRTNTKGGKRTPRHKSGLTLTQIVILYLLLLALMFSFLPRKTTYKIQQQEEVPVEVIRVEDKKSEPKLTERDIIVREIIKTFPENPVTMVAIALEESGLNPRAVGYNCRYKIGGDTYDKLTHLYIDLNTVSKERLSGYVSTWCRQGDEKYAWSKDGGVLQISNFKSHELAIEVNIQIARNKYDTQGLNAWVAYNTGRYKKHLALAQELVAKNTD